jgi:hypothetical protein
MRSIKHRNELLAAGKLARPSQGRRRASRPPEGPTRRRRGRGHDAAVVCSPALQYGVPLETIRRALMHDARSKASSRRGTALDILEKREP